MYTRTIFAVIKLRQLWIATAYVQANIKWSCEIKQEMTKGTRNSGSIQVPQHTLL